nr:MAG TPA: hypothetical protein [Caudoviricetes sp.]
MKQLTERAIRELIRKELIRLARVDRTSYKRTN